MGLTKRDLEEINEELQRRVAELTAENTILRTQIERLTSTLGNSTGRVRELEELYARLERRYARLKSLLIEHLDASA
jgi:predicted nuclease with TOPRIM domain